MEEVTYRDVTFPEGTVVLVSAFTANRDGIADDAFDITADRVQTDYNQEQIPPARRGLPARQRITAAYRVTISNAKAESVTVDVREARFGSWKIIESSVPPEKLSSTEQRFRVTVPANGEATLTYTLQFET
jgi:hypothetical protein